MQNSLTIGALANQAGVTSETLRYYERMGLIAPNQRTASNYRLYDQETARRVRFIRKAQTLGFSLSEIGQLLSLHSYPGTDMGEVKALAQAKIDTIQSKIDDLMRMKQGLAALVEQCPGHGSAACCPILGALLDDDD